MYQLEFFYLRALLKVHYEKRLTKTEISALNKCPLKQFILGKTIVTTDLF